MVAVSVSHFVAPGTVRQSDTESKTHATNHIRPELPSAADYASKSTISKSLKQHGKRCSSTKEGLSALGNSQHLELAGVLLPAVACAKRNAYAKEAVISDNMCRHLGKNSEPTAVRYALWLD